MLINKCFETIAAIAIIGCCSCSKMEKSEQATISVETAIIDGRTAGRLYVAKPNKEDTAENNVRMRSMREKYDTMADRSYVQAFDTAMLHTVKKFRPSAVENLPK